MRARILSAKPVSTPGLLNGASALLTGLRLALRPRLRSGDRLDPRGLSGHLQRDLGFCDGNDPRSPRP